MKKKVLLFTISLFMGTAATLRAQDPEPLPVRFVNTGRMSVAPNGTATALYIPYSVLMADDPNASSSKVSILQQGTTSIGGSLYQESASNVFQVNNGWGTSTGTVVFSGADPTGKRFVRTLDADDMTTFERAAHYVAFPNLKIATDDVIHIPGRMGIDASSVSYREGGEKGILYLHSDVLTAENGTKKVFDASLRISAVGVADAADRTSEKLVAAGSVVVERNVSVYRSNTGLLFPFASPFEELRAGYYAGNFVRQFIEDPTSGHVEYVLANEDADSDGWIDFRYYLQKANDLFTPGKGYLIKPREADFDYGDLNFELTNGTDADLYNKGTFVFNGEVYNLEKKKEQLFARDEVFKKEITTETTYTNTVNLIVGNSYTSALSMAEIREELRNTDLSVSSTIYVYMTGSTSYQPYKLGSELQLLDLPEIPSQTYFMVRLSKGKDQKGSFAIDREMQTHGKLSNNFLRSANNYNNEVVFRVSPEDNRNVYDLAMIALRTKASGSIGKVSNPQRDAFQLYAANKQSIAVETEDTKSVPLGFVPSANVSGYTLTVSREESMRTAGLWLEDRKTGKYINLWDTNEYTFNSESGDMEERFVVHFTDKNPTGIDENNINNTPLTVYYADNALHIRGLLAEDINAPVRISDIQGRLLMTTSILNHPEERIAANLASGVYLMHVGGERNQTIKFVVKGGTR